MSTASATTTLKTGQKSSARQSKKVILRLRPDLLARFPTDPPTKTTPTKTNGTSRPSSTGDDDQTPVPDSKKPAVKPVLKRTSSTALLDAAGRPKGRPGPKKKPRLADGTIDRSNETPKPVTANPTTAPAAHKAGPRGGTGAINAGLRALDRSGKPCRKWDRQGFKLKSFTGVAWGLGSWSAPLRDASSFSGDVKSDSSSMGDVKQTMESSAQQSESSRNGETTLGRTNGIASSPIPMQA